MKKTEEIKEIKTEAEEIKTEAEAEKIKAEAEKIKTEAEAEEIKAEAEAEAESKAEVESKAEAEAEAEVKNVINSYTLKDNNDITLFTLFTNKLKAKHITEKKLFIMIEKNIKNHDDKIGKHIKSVLKLSVKYANMKIVLKYDYLYFDTIKKAINLLYKLRDNSKVQKTVKNDLAKVYNKNYSPKLYNNRLLEKIEKLSTHYLPKKEFKVNDNLKDNLLTLESKAKNDLIYLLLKNTSNIDYTLLLTEAEAKKAIKAYELKAKQKAEAEAKKKAEAEAKVKKAEAEVKSRKQKQKQKAEAEVKKAEAELKKAEVSYKKLKTEKSKKANIAKQKAIKETIAEAKQRVVTFS